MPAGSKPPAAVRVRISTGERYGFGAAAPLSTRTSSLELGRAGGPVESLSKLARQIGSGSTSAEELFPLIIRSAAAVPSVRLQVLVYFGMFGSMTRRGCQASCSRLAERCSGSLVFSISSSLFFYLVDRNDSQLVLAIYRI